ncbi:hypothetical protein [Pseudomonas sp.]|uniref:hypothetical protein n=1 Tax=Pseudomonas sp. TaxID=306 RepID=UPI003D0C5A42
MTTPSGKSPNVYRLHISQSAFEVTLAAVHNISLRNKRHEALSAVLHEAITAYSTIPRKVLDDLSALHPVRGDIPIIAIVTSDLQPGFDRIRSELKSLLGPNCGTREAVIACCLLVAPAI